MKDPALNPIHPGEVLLEDFLKPLGISPSRLAADIHVQTRRINQIVSGRRGVCAEMALRWACYFRTTPQFWLNLQSHYELDVARLASEKAILKSVRPAPALAKAA
jgi:antitoxin HigA-1